MDSNQWNASHEEVVVPALAWKNDDVIATSGALFGQSGQFPGTFDGTLAAANHCPDKAKRERPPNVVECSTIITEREILGRSLCLDLQ